MAQLVKNLPAVQGDPGLIPVLDRLPGEGNGGPLQYSCLKNSVVGGTWWATVHGPQRVTHNYATNKRFHTLYSVSLVQYIPLA